MSRPDPSRVRPPWLCVLATLLVVLLCASCRATAPIVPQKRVLFVGNSLTYVGNVPAIFSALSAANGRAVGSDMIVRGGATLAQRVADGSVAAALASGDYVAVVLQERGGDLICSFGPQSCIDSRAAIAALSEMARTHAVKVILLGTYQPRPGASRRIVEREAEIAGEVGITHVEVSETLLRLRAVHPELAWFAEDGMHPGQDLALLNAMLVHRALHGAWPRPTPLTVMAPIYGVSSGLTATLRASDAPAAGNATPPRAQYAAVTLARILDGVVKATEE